MSTRPVRTLTVLAAAAASVLGATAALAPAASAATSAAPGSVTLSNTLPRWLAKAQPAATPQVAAPMSVRVYLAPRTGLASLQAAVAAVSDPASPQYRHFLSQPQFDARYAPSAAAVAQVRTYLRTQGVRVDGVEAHHRYLDATADRATLARAFGTQLAGFTHDGQTVVAPTRAVSLPAAVGRQVLTVTGLDTTITLKKHNSIAPEAPAASPAATKDPALTVTPPNGFRNGRPCAINYGVLDAKYQADYKTPLPKFMGKTLPYAPCGYTGPQFRAAYEGQTPLDGAGVTVAITDAYAWQLVASDANRYASQNGDGSYAPGQLTQSLPKTYRYKELCDPSGWAGEEVLDVEAVHAMAPAANIRYYGSRSCFDNDFQDTLARVVDENKAQIVTNSWSDVEENQSGSSVAAYEQVFLQGAMQGISFYFSSGDSGDELGRTGVRQVDYPASDPYVTGAGGTSTAISRGQLLGQGGWGTRELLALGRRQALGRHRLPLRRRRRLLGAVQPARPTRPARSQPPRRPAAPSRTSPWTPTPTPAC